MTEPSELSAAAEAAWLSLRQHAEWSSGGWLAWVFTDDARVTRELVRRLAGLSVHGVVSMGVRSRADVPAVLAGLLQGDAAPGHVWVAVDGASEDARVAWRELHLRLNERREALRERLAGGLVLSAPTAWKADARDAAPDLWSVRSLVVEPPPVVARWREGGLDARATGLSEPEDAPVDGELAEQALRAALRAGDPDAEAVARTRLARFLLASERPGDAREHAAYAVEAASGGLGKARAYAVLAEAERSLGDRVAAEAHFAAAVRWAAGAGGEAAVWWARDRATLLRVLGRVGEAEPVARDALTLADALVPPAPGVRAAALDALGDVLRDLGRVEEAHAAYAESLLLRRQLRALLGDQPTALRDLSLSLDKVGDASRDRGRLEEALAAYAESLALARQLRALSGDQPTALRDLSVSLDKVGDASRDVGRLEDAHAAYAESLALCRQLRASLGDQPTALRDLSISLERVGATSQDLGRVEEAHAAYAESLALRRQLRASLGDQPLLLADAARAAGRLATTCDGAAAAALWAECLDAATRAYELSPTKRHEELVAWARTRGA